MRAYPPRAALPGMHAFATPFVVGLPPCRLRPATCCLAALVNAAYRLTPEDEAVLWETAPPRMPVGDPRPNDAERPDLPTR